MKLASDATVSASMPAPAESPPLPLEPFEEYFLRDERPGSPMVFPLTMAFQGRIDRPAFERSLTETLAVEPLLSAYVKRRGRRLIWSPQPTPPSVNWEEGSAGLLDDQAWDATPVLPIDLGSAPGLRVVASVRNDQIKLICYFHHASTDGLGAIRFMFNVLARYGELVGDDAGLSTTLPQPELAAQRGDLCVELPEPVSAASIARSIVCETYKWLAQRPKPLASRAPAQRDVQQPVMLSKYLDDELVSQLRAVGRRQGCSLNDLLMRDLFLTIDDWNRSLREINPGDVIRILMPTNLRKAAHYRMPASNLIGYAFLTRTAGECERPDDLLVGITEEIKLIRKWSLGAMFIDGLKVMRRIPLAIRILTSSRFCHATCVMSNMGPCQSVATQSRFRRAKTIKVGDLELRELYAAPPVRPNTWASLGAIGYRDSLCLALSVDLNQVTAEQGREFFDRYCRRLEKTAAET